MSDHAKKITADIEALMGKLRGALEGWTKSHNFIANLTEEELAMLRRISLKPIDWNKELETARYAPRKENTT